ncbi:MAG: hypothetical protein ACPGVG_20490 [Mycobacterium sp.]
MQRPATWKVVTVSAAMAGLGVLGTGAAMADDSEMPPNICCEVPVTATGDGDTSESDPRLRYRFTPINGGDASPEDSRLWYQFPIEAHSDGDMSLKESRLSSWYVGLQPGR